MLLTYKNSNLYTNMKRATKNGHVTYKHSLLTQLRRLCISKWQQPGQTVTSYPKSWETLNSCKSTFSTGACHKPLQTLARSKLLPLPDMRSHNLSSGCYTTTPPIAYRNWLALVQMLLQSALQNTLLWHHYNWHRSASAPHSPNRQG